MISASKLWIILFMTVEPSFSLVFQPKSPMSQMHSASSVESSDHTPLELSSQFLNLLTSRIQRHQQRRRRHIKAANMLKKFQSMDFFDPEAEHQFCGETLVYAVEYYCVNIRGTSVYTPDYNFEETYVYGENESGDKSRRHAARANELLLGSYGIVDECCYQACNARVLDQYCNY